MFSKIAVFEFYHISKSLRRAGYSLVVPGHEGAISVDPPPGTIMLIKDIERDVILNVKLYAVKGLIGGVGPWESD